MQTACRASKSWEHQNIRSLKDLLSIRWEHGSVIYNKLLKPSENFTVE